MADYALPKAVDFKNMSQKAKAAVNWSQGWIQRKYDGCAVIIRVLPDGTKTAISATGKPVKSLDHVLARLRPMDKPYTLCGEAILRDRPFAESSGAFRRHSVQPDLFVQLFDGAVDGEEQRPYKERKNLLYHLSGVDMDRGLGAVFGVVHSQYCEGPENAQKWGMAYADDKPTNLNRFFCDGAIWRDPEAPFEIGRSKGSIIKIKPLMECDLLVVGTEEGKGKYVGKIGALVCKYKDAKLVKVATGMTDAERAQAPADFIGAIVSVAAMGETEDGLLREPRYRGIRIDKLAADY
jgi:ATP-dependent DNA ligase